MEHHHSQQPNNMDLDKRSLVTGFVGGFMSLCTIGFFVLLGVVLNDGGAPSAPARAAAPNPTNIAGAEAPAPTPSPSVSIELTDGDYFKGDLDAPITIVEYSDIDCPFCEKFHPTVEQVLNDNPGKVNWVYRHFPLRSLHPQAAAKAEGAECAGIAGGVDAFWGYIDEAFTGVALNTADQMEDLAAKHGANRGEFQECIESGAGAQLVQEDEATGLAAGAQGTPYSLILGPNGETIPLSGALPASQIQQVIDSLL